MEYVIERDIIFYVYRTPFVDHGLAGIVDFVETSTQYILDTASATVGRTLEKHPPHSAADGSRQK